MDSQEKDLLKAYAHTYGKTVSDFMREVALDRIHDELDLQAWDAAKEEYIANPISYSAQEMAEKYR
jgi:uncharacterized protein (DUF1778 family)